MGHEGHEGLTPQADCQQLQSEVQPNHEAPGVLPAGHHCIHVPPGRHQVHTSILNTPDMLHINTAYVISDEAQAAAVHMHSV